MSNQTTLIPRIEQALDEIRPYLETDGGNVKVLGVDDDNVVLLELLGSCGHCPMSVMTMKAGVEETIKRLVPEITNVRAVNMTSPDDPNAQLPENLR
ncbi:MAG: NifU family protein [Bacteroidota bacterium]